MNESQELLEVLMYLIDNYTDADNNLVGDPDQVSIELEAAGFEQEAIDGAFNWLQEIVEVRMDLEGGDSLDSTARVYTPYEASRLDVRTQGFLVYLQQTGVLSKETREEVISRALSLESEQISVEQLKWIVLTVIFRRKLPGFAVPLQPASSEQYEILH